MTLQRAAHMTHYGAFESTRIHGSGTDILATTRHIERWRDDLDLLRSAGMNDLRYSIPWHRIEQHPGRFDFSWMDGPMDHLRKTGMNPVVDLLHHTSFPDWLTDGFAHPDFPGLYARFVRRFVERYPWVNRFTLFNEPLATTLMCSVIGAWYPYRRSDEAFAEMAVNVARAICLCQRLVRHATPNATFVYIDTCEHHQALDRSSHEWVNFVNERRYCMLDLVTGKVDEAHPLYSWFRKSGATSDDLKWLRDHAAVPDLLGLDYYPHSEIDWFRNTRNGGRIDISAPVASPRGFAAVAQDYVERYRLPVMLTETNIRGTIFDRITWLRFMEEQVSLLVERGVDIRGFCWYPSIDSTDWGNLCAKCTRWVDPQGIWYLEEADHRWTRFSSELSDWHERLARGTATHSDLPAYCFLPPLDKDLAGYMKLMRHWDNWIEAPGSRKAA